MWIHTMQYTILRSWSMEFRVYSLVSDADVYCICMAKYFGFSPVILWRDDSSGQLGIHSSN